MSGIVCGESPSQGMIVRKDVSLHGSAVVKGKLHGRSDTHSPPYDLSGDSIDQYSLFMGSYRMQSPFFPFQRLPDRFAFRNSLAHGTK